MVKLKPTKINIYPKKKKNNFLNEKVIRQKRNNKKNGKNVKLIKITNKNKDKKVGNMNNKKIKRLRGINDKSPVLKTKKKYKSLKSLNLISPFYINNNSCFYYDLENFNDFKKYTDDINKYKLTKEEIQILYDLVNNIIKSNNITNFSKSINIIPELYESFTKLEISHSPLNKIAKTIKTIIDEDFINIHFSIRKIYLKIFYFLFYID